ncbi:MAG: CoA pyrophosphatase [Alphaproteobacteria bacterium]
MSLHRDHISNRLDLPPDYENLAIEQVKPRSDADLSPEWNDLVPAVDKLKPAAVLIPLVERAAGLSVLLTERATHLNKHAGEVSFPGGRIEDDDAHPIAAALREAEEEVGLDPNWVEVAGILQPFHTGTGFRILPIVGFVEPRFEVHELPVDKSEVAEAFEVPLSFLMNADNHERHKIDYKGRTRHYYAMPYDGHYIWGATAGMLVNLFDVLFPELETV